MYILILLEGLLFADTIGNVVSTNWLDYVQDLEAMCEYSWGSAVLACLYSRMCIASRAETKSTGGPYLLLQVNKNILHTLFLLKHTSYSLKITLILSSFGRGSESHLFVLIYILDMRLEITQEVGDGQMIV